MDNRIPSGTHTGAKYEFVQGTSGVKKHYNVAILISCSKPALLEALHPSIDDRNGKRITLDWSGSMHSLAYCPQHSYF